MNILLTEYEIETGRIIANTSRPADREYAVPEGHAVLTGYVDAATQYIVGGVPTLRPRMEAGWRSKDSAPAVLSLDALPNGAKVTLRNEAGEELVIQVPSEPIELTDPGTYRIEVPVLFPYRLDDGDTFLLHTIEVT